VSVTGLPVWLNPTQTVVVNTIAAGFSVNALVTGPVSISALPAVSISVSAVLGTIITQLGTQVVTVVPGLSVSAVVSGTVSIAQVTTAVPHISQTGIVMWIAGGQSTTATPVVITGTVTAGAGTTVVSVTGSVTVVAGLSVSAVVSGTVTAIPVDRTTALPSVSATGGIMWVANTAAQITTAAPGAGATGVAVWVANPGAAVATTVISVTVITQLGTQVVSVVPGLSVSAVVSGTVTVNGSVSLSGTGLVSVVPGVSVTVVT